MRGTVSLIRVEKHPFSKEEEILQTNLAISETVKFFKSLFALHVSTLS
jgi:hypothetical protein